MDACQHCQELLLDHLYDLLPEAEQASLLAHLQTCSACRQALAQARAQQHLLATAAKRTFPDVTFHKPEPMAVAEPTPPTLPPRVASQAAVSRWYTLAALAAGLLLCLGSVQVWYLRSQQHAQREQVAQLLAVTREQLRQEQQNQHQEIESLERDFRQELQHLQNQADSQHLRLVVTGPRHLPPGTPAEYTVQTFDRQGKPLEALVQVEVDRANVSALTRRKQLEDRSSPPRADADSAAGSGSIGANAPAQPGVPRSVAPASPPPGLSAPGLPPESPSVGNTASTPGTAPAPRAAPADMLGKGRGPLQPKVKLPALGVRGGTPERNGSDRLPPRSSPPIGFGSSLPQPSASPRNRVEAAQADKVAKPLEPLTPPREATERGGEGKDHSPEAHQLKEVRRETLPLQRVAPGTYKLTVPPDVVPEGGELAMNVRALAARQAADREPLSLEGKVPLSAPIYRTYLTTDRPWYRPGQTVRFRTLTLEQARLTPPEEEASLVVTLGLPHGAQQQLSPATTALAAEYRSIVTAEGQPLPGLKAGSFVLPTDASPGVYTLKVSSAKEGYLEASRSFQVQDAKPALGQATLRFHRDSYGPGEEVQAELLLRRVDGTPLANAPVSAVLTVDGLSRPALTTTTSATGQARLRFTLPVHLTRGEAILRVTSANPNDAEVIEQPIPVRPQRVQLEFFPEGGELVVGLPSRVYFQARNPLGQPVAVRGTLLEDGKPTDVHLTTWQATERPELFQGRGVFAFTPKPEARYSVRLEAPAGLKQNLFPLPVPRSQGVTLRVDGGVFAAGEPIRVQLHSDRPRDLLVGLYGRQGLLDLQTLPAGQSDVILRPNRGESHGGVCRISVVEMRPQPGGRRQPVPLAQRLVYCHPTPRLQVRLQPQRQEYRPGERVQVQLSARDENNEPLAAIAQVQVVAEELLKQGGPDTTPSLPAYFLLGSEVRPAEELRQADALLASDPQAALALDLLLATQSPPPRPGLLQADTAAGVSLHPSPKQAAHELSTLQQQSAELTARYLQRGLSLLNTLQQQRQQRLEEWHTAQAEAQQAAERSFAAGKRLRDLSALLAGLLAVLFTLIALALPTRGPCLLLAFVLSATALILVSLVPLSPPDVPHQQTEQLQSLLEAAEWKLWEKLQRWQTHERAELDSQERHSKPESSLPSLPSPGDAASAAVAPPERLLAAQPASHDTPYWQPALLLPQGEATFSFAMPQAQGDFRILALVHTLDGRLASVSTTISPPPRPSETRK